MQQLQRTNNTRRNITWGFAGRALTLLCPFITRTALIYALGAEYLGISSLYTSILQVLSLAELGFATAVVYSMYKPVAEGDVAQVAAYLNYFKRVYRWVGLAILAMGLAVAPFLESLVEGSWPDDVNLRTAFFIYLANTVIGYFLFAYKQSLLNAYQRNDAVSKVAMVTAALQCAVQVAILAAAPNFYAFALVLPACTVFSNLATAWAVRRLLPEFGDRALREQSLTSTQRRDVRKRVAGLVFNQICGTTRDSFASIFVSSFLGLTLVAAYSNYFVVLSALHGILTVICTSMTAAVGHSVVTEAKDKNAADLRLFVFLYALLSIVCAAVMLACYQPFMALWVGNTLVLPFTIPLLMTIYFYALTMGDIRSVYVNATGIWWEQRWRALFEAIANLALDWMLVQLLGLPGVIVGTLISLFLINFVYGSHLAFKYYFGLEKARMYYIDHAVYLGACAAICTVTYFVVNLIPDGDIAMLLLKVAAAVACSVVLLLAAFGWTERFKVALSFMRRAFRKR